MVSTAQALGLRAGQRAVIVNGPTDFMERLRDLPFGVNVTEHLGPFRSDMIIVFVSVRRVLEQRLPALRRSLAVGGTLWVAWPQRGAARPTDVNERVLREVARAGGMQGTEIVSIDNMWSGLRLVPA